MITKFKEGDVVNVEKDGVEVLYSFQGTIVFVDQDTGLITVEDQEENAFDCDLEQLSHA